MNEIWNGVVVWLLNRISHAPLKIVEMGFKLIQCVVCCGLVDLCASRSLQASIWKLFVFSDPQACTLTTTQFMSFVVTLCGLQEVLTNQLFALFSS